MLSSALHGPLELRPGAVPWAACATDPPKLRSLLYNGAAYAKVRLFLQPAADPGGSNVCSGGGHSSYALTRETLTGCTIRYAVFGRRQASDTDIQPEYAHAVAAIAADGVPLVKLSALPAAALPYVKAGLTAAGYEQSSFHPCTQFVVSPRAMRQLTAERAASAKRLAAAGLTLGELHRDDAALVDSLWSFQGPGTLPLVQSIIDQGETVCVRNSDGRPLSWALEVEPGCVGMLHTLDDCRRQGLARAVMAELLWTVNLRAMKWGDSIAQPQHGGAHGCQDAVNSSCCEHGNSNSDAGSSGSGAYCYVVQDNAASVALMHGLGLDCTGEFLWMSFVQKREAPQCR